MRQTGTNATRVVVIVTSFVRRPRRLGCHASLGPVALTAPMGSASAPHGFSPVRPRRSKQDLRSVRMAVALGSQTACWRAVPKLASQLAPAGAIPGRTSDAGSGAGLCAAEPCVEPDAAEARLAHRH